MTELRKGHLLATLLLLAGACNGDDKDPADDTDDTDDTNTCVAEIASTFPTQDATNVFYRTPIEITFKQAEQSTATITLKDGAGADVAGSVSWSADGKTAAFTPAADLAASTQYTLTAAYSCDKTAEINFTTSDTGSAVDANTLIDNVYSVDFLSGRITEPPGVGELLGGLLASAGEIYILVSPTSIVDGDIEMRGALGADDGGSLVQDECTPSINFPIAADYSEDPFFEISGNDVTLEVEGFSIEIATLALSGAFAPDGSRIDGIAIEAFADTRPLVAAFGEDLGVDPEDPAALCTFVTGLLPTVQCDSCSGNGTDDKFCLKLAIDSMTGELVTGLEGLDFIEQADVDANPACAAE